MKTLEVKLNETKEYLAKSAQHLFVVNENQITKVITFTRDGKEYFTKLVIQNDKVYLNTYPSGQMKWDVKYTLFPQYVKTKSIPYFKKMREIVELVEAKIQVGDNTALIGEIQEKVKSLELVK
jgi:hypothetical protein